MEKGKKITDAFGGEFLLPEAIIQHIQSLLDRKLAAQTCILSKSWYRAWSTRPHLHLDQRSFQNRDEGNTNPQAKGDFSEFARMTVQRYEEMKLKVESLKLYMEINGFRNYLLAHELIGKAIMMGASDLDFEFLPENSTLAFPITVLESENLVRLSAIGCKIDGKVSCSKLKSLSLCRVHIETDLISDIIASCPLIENFSLSDCQWKNKMLTLSPTVEFHKLKCLSLEKVKVDSLFFHDFSRKFPCLKDLNLHHCTGYKARHIYSNSLECISITQARNHRLLYVEFIVPSIRKFSFSGSRILFPTFVASSSHWESDISISCPGVRLGAQWFHKLKLLLTKLTPSKISLSLNIGCSLESSFDYTENVQSLPRPVVENLTLTMAHVAPPVSSALLEGVFWSCCPKLITQYWLPKSCKGGNANRDFLEGLCKSLIQEVSENVSVPNRIMFGLLDLEEVNVEIFEESVGEWWLLHWKTLLDASAFPEHKRKIRFQLRWRAEPITFK